MEFGVISVGLRSPPTPIFMVDPPLSRTITVDDIVDDAGFVGTGESELELGELARVEGVNSNLSSTRNVKVKLDSYNLHPYRL